MGSHLYAVLGTSTCQSISTHDARKPRSARAMPAVLTSIGAISCIASRNGRQDPSMPAASHVQ
ncbi:hypothetical protein ASPFODRAFT_44565 [Aspergillus luchuensis CBS 106.47]|uniref:Uncharacterized protein n=1 Tax=Aspergillus luchuensis (strain CBS 106.47) TaxID=1137211 RepID=A0A1M3TPX7_ASPLC|nr:hypothetical protein ASPFODRAFT_44565 [Aspergillus luchuensis CBS 106.47]